MTNPAERWRPVVGYEGFYEVSDLGRVRSLPHWRRSKANSRSFHAGRLLRLPIASGGYPQAHLSMDGRTRCIHVHRLVAAAFIGGCPDGQLVRHLDGDPANNVLANLSYGTPHENQLDKVRHGRCHNARKTHCKYGHPFDQENTWIERKSDGTFQTRRCRACRSKRKTATESPVFLAA
jgi:hypothetical protein